MNRMIPPLVDGSETQMVEGAVKLIRQLLQGYRQLLLVRVDLAMCDEYKASTSIFDIQGYRTRLWSNRRSKPSIFEHCLGWVWGMEYGEDCGYHLHCLFIFNGRAVQRDIWYGDQIGEYWNQVITAGKGRYYNCNRYKDSYQFNGIGKLHSNDVEKFSHLQQRVLPYLAKADGRIQQAMQLDAQATGHPVSHIRTFGHSNNL